MIRFIEKLCLRAAIKGWDVPDYLGVVVKKDWFGFAKAEPLPYIYRINVFGGPRTLDLVVWDNVPEHGFLAAEPIKPSPCTGCIYSTGEKLLPCAVNPMAFNLGCRDYTN